MTLKNKGDKVCFLIFYLFFRYEFIMFEIY